MVRFYKERAPGFQMNKKSQHAVLLQRGEISVHTKSVSRPRGCRRRNTKTRKRENAKHKNAKTRKRRKHNPFRSTLNTNVITDLGMCRYVRQQSIPYTSNTNFITALGMCKVCTEAAQSVALWTWTLSQLWACVCTEAVLPVALWTWTLSQLWACVRYMYRSSPFRSTMNTNVITALGMRKVCTEAVHSVALWTRTLSQLWACVKYAPKQPSP